MLPSWRRNEVLGLKVLVIEDVPAPEDEEIFITTNTHLIESFYNFER